LAGPAGTFGPWPPETQTQIIEVMFVAQELTISAGFRAAQARFANLIRGNWLTETSAAAYGEEVTGLMRVGPARLAAKLVRVTVVEPIYRADTMSVGIRWEATGATGALFPVLDATITISPADPPAPEGKDAARLALAGSYRPPLGRLGAGLDTAILHRVANATIHSVLRTAAAALTSPAADAAASSNDPIPRPAPETGM
jgi:hypothetical protein